MDLLFLRLTGCYIHSVAVISHHFENSKKLVVKRLDAAYTEYR
jgi:hypothetical protein